MSGTISGSQENSEKCAADSKELLGKCNVDAETGAMLHIRPEELRAIGIDPEQTNKVISEIQDGTLQIIPVE
jgi:hypothetical protein